jgi:PAS domain S-box-containing protein
MALSMIFCAGGLIFYNHQKKIFVSEKHNNLIAISQLKVDQIVNWRNERLGNASTIFNNLLAIDAVHEMITGTRPDENYRKLSEWLFSIQKSYDYSSVLLLDTNLQILISSSPVEPVGVFGKKMALQAMMEKKIIFTDLNKSDNSGPHIGLIIPLFSSHADTTGLIGVIFFRIDAERFLFPLIQTWPTPSRTSETILIRKEGNNVLYLNELRHRKNTALNLVFPLTDTLLPATKAALGITGIVEGRDYRGKRVLANIEKIPGTTWFMITKVDADEIFYPLREQALSIFLLIVLLILVGALIIYVLWRRHALAAEIEQTALLRHFDNFFKYASDAIILTDANGNITQINEKACSIYGYYSEELMKLNFSTLVLPKTKNQTELIFSLPNKSAEGTIFETRHIRKNGEIFPVEISSRSIRVNDSEFFQAIIRDITERKAAEETILINEARLSSLLRLSQHQTKTIQEFLDFALEEAINLTQSKIGYIYFYDEDKQEFTLNSWSGKVLDECTIIDPQTIYELEKTGIWGEAVRQRKPIMLNDFQAEHPLKKGYPEGHTPLHKYLTIPVIIENKIVAVVAVANKETNYTNADVNQLTLMMDSVWRITERKKAETELIKNRRFLSDLIENSGTIIYVKDLEGKYVLVNRKWEAVSDLSREFAIGKTDKELFPGEKGQQFYLDDQEAIKSGILIEKEEMLLDSSGIRYFISIKFPMLDENNLINGICVISMDITGRKQAEEDIIKINENLEKTISERTSELLDLYNNAPCGYHSLNNDAFFELINDTELKWLGYEREEIVGKLKFSDVISIESKKTFAKNFPIFKQQGWITDLEFDMIRKDGTVLPVLLSATALYDQQGNYLRSRMTIIDHTHRKKAADLLNEANHKLENTNMELEAFAYSVSHDLRAPLRGIDGWSLALLEDFGHLFDEKAQQYLGRVRSETQRMGHLIDDMLKLSRVNRSEMKLEIVEFSALISSITQRIQEANPQRRFEFTIQPGLMVIGDPQLLEIALTNLLDNAVKFTGMREITCIEFGVIVIGDELNYYIRDNGVGFDMNYSKKLFGAFQRMHKQTDFPGTGIGLATVQRIIHRHSGQIWAEAKVDEGAAFYFTIGTRL